MAVLSAQARRRLPPNAFAGPNRSYPVEDKAHARAALLLINKGSLDAAEKAKVRARAQAMLKRG